VGDVTQGETRIVSYLQDRPVKYLAVVVGRLEPAGELARGPRRLRAWAVPRQKAGGPAALARAFEILEYFDDAFGECPYPDLELVLLEDKVPGGYSPAGMVVLRERPSFVTTHLRDDPASFADVPGLFLAHELAHQWWGQAVSGQNYRERWLAEGAAQFAATLWVRRSLGEEAELRVLRRMAGWAERCDSRGPVHLGQRLGHIENDPQIYRALVYDKGAFVFRMLRGLIGPEAFRAGLQDFLRGHIFGKAGTEELRKALERVSGASLAAYFEAWIYRTGIAHLGYRTETRRAARGYLTAVRIEAAGTPGPLPLQIRVSHQGGSVVEGVLLPVGGGQWEIATPTAPERVEINADLGLLARVERR
jgi:aminopeptidase N